VSFGTVSNDEHFVTHPGVRDAMEIHWDLVVSAAARVVPKPSSAYLDTCSVFEVVQNPSHIDHIEERLNHPLPTKDSSGESRMRDLSEVGVGFSNSMAVCVKPICHAHFPHLLTSEGSRGLHTTLRRFMLFVVAVVFIAIMLAMLVILAMFSAVALFVVLLVFRHSFLFSFPIATLWLEILTSCDRHIP